VSSGALLPLTAFQSPRTSLTMRGQSLPVAWLPSSATSRDSTVTHPAPPAPTAGAEGEETKSGAGEGKGEGEATKPAVGKRVLALSVGGCACVVPLPTHVHLCSPSQALARACSALLCMSSAKVFLRCGCHTRLVRSRTMPTTPLQPQLSPFALYFFLLIHRFHSISFTRAQGIPKYKLGFGREKDGRVGERLVHLASSNPVLS